MEEKLGQSTAVLFKYEKLILAEEETTSAGGCGVSLAAFSRLRQPVFMTVRRGLFSIAGKESKNMSLKYTCPGCGTPLGYEGLCWKCKSEQERKLLLPGRRNRLPRSRET